MANSYYWECNYIVVFGDEFENASLKLHCLYSVVSLESSMETTHGSICLHLAHSPQWFCIFQFTFKLRIFSRDQSWVSRHWLQGRLKDSLIFAVEYVTYHLCP